MMKRNDSTSKINTNDKFISFSLSLNCINSNQLHHMHKDQYNVYVLNRKTSYKATYMTLNFNM